MGLKATIRTPSKLTVDIKKFAGGAGGKQQIYIGPDEPIDENILIWIDTSGTTPSTNIQLVTSNNENFITSNDESFIVKEN